ncbi:ATP-dependent DNA helicase Q-like 5 isoform X3 [Dioscorea cayenensis subsp. rotundata]|uniref:DNA 3'-5' helicase n=1 Tax=Dioscorea cayennensis subsp. rotundata TaxID=55577 RepID=A0AB40BA92_DIOCR|nr:ATP-dependent DNA helicase Q-like 5 isoform X3 [Dioscorea cayenensis subsp. rotundata]
MNSDSDSAASHVSSTPPRIPNPKPFPRSEHKRKSSPKSQPSHPPTPSSGDPPITSLHGVPLKIHRSSSSDHHRSTSFSTLFKSRRPAFDPFDLQSIADPSPPKKPPPPDRVDPSKLHRNWIPSSAPPELPQKRLRFSSEGNFVRLNINGYGRRHSFRNGRKGKKLLRFRKRSGKPRTKSTGENEVEMGCLEEEEEEEESCLGDFQMQERSSGFDLGRIEEAIMAAREDPSEVNLLELLRLVYGHSSFRDGQLEAIQKVVAGESTMLVLPTGAGKSLCYQLPALILPGVTLVVSPLVALMVDQLKHLPSVIPGGLLSSNQTNEEASATLDRLREGKIKVLFVSPERFLNKGFLSVFGSTIISFVAVDEAHCISEWSHNFRPSYLRLRASILRAKLNVKCMLAMTATATSKTLQEIMHALEIPAANLIQTCQIRDNIQLFVISSGNRLKDLLMLMKSSSLVDKQSVIIYCKFQVETDMVTKYLCDNNILAKGYHSSLPARDRNRIQELFCSNKIRVVVATVAFGMGLDKSDVDLVIHYSLPESLEEYVQKTGRAGRDGRLSFCHLLLDDLTYYKLRSLLYSDGVDEYAINKLLCEIFSDGIVQDGHASSLVKESASRKFDMKEEVLLTILTQLELGDVQYLHLLPQLNVTCTLYFHKTSPDLLSKKDILIATIMKKSEIKQGYFVFDIPTVANTVGITPTDLLNKLKNLKFMGEITYDLKDPAFCFTIIKVPDDYCSLTSRITNWLSEVEQCKVQKLDEMFHVATFAAKECPKVDGCFDNMHTPCIQKKILDYFCRDANAPSDDVFTKMGRSSPFLHADIKVFLQSNSHVKFTPRAIARIMHGIPSPSFPSATWSKCHFWERYSQIDFAVVMKAATSELMHFDRKT